MLPVFCQTNPIYYLLAIPTW